MRERYPDYHNRPVAPFGDAGAKLVIVGPGTGFVQTTVRTA